jgi:hypothetical protein
MTRFAGINMDWGSAPFSDALFVELRHGGVERGGRRTMVKVPGNPNVTLDGGVLLIDLGKHSKKQIKRLRQGTGKLIDEVHKCMQELRAAGTASESAQPVILVREKQGRSRLF